MGFRVATIYQLVYGPLRKWTLMIKMVKAIIDIHVNELKFCRAPSAQ